MIINDKKKKIHLHEYMQVIYMNYGRHLKWNPIVLVNS